MKTPWRKPADGGSEHTLSVAREHDLDAPTPLSIETWLSGEAEHRVEHEYDTLDRDLERLEIRLARAPSEAGVVWRLTLPRGERVEAWEPGTSGLLPPSEILRLIEAVVAGKKLVPTAPAGTDPELREFRALLGDARVLLLAHDPGVRVGEDGENLRQLRIALSRIRTLVRSSSRYLDASWRESTLAELGQVLDASDQGARLDALVERIQPSLDQPNGDDRSGTLELSDLLADARRYAHGRTVDALEDQRYHVLLARLQLPPRLKAGADALPLQRIVRRDVRRIARAVQRTGEVPEGTLLGPFVGALDRAGHFAELAAASRKLTQRFLDHAAEVRTLLAEHQETFVAEQLLRDATVVDRATAAAFVAGRFAEQHASRRAQLLEQLPAAWRRLRRSGGKIAA